MAPTRDGLFSQNPPVRELVDTRPDELWVIQINPSARDGEPTTTVEIADRRNELSGNLSLHQELGFIEKINQLLDEGCWRPAGATGRSWSGWSSWPGRGCRGRWGRPPSPGPRPGRAARRQGKVTAFRLGG